MISRVDVIVTDVVVECIRVHFVFVLIFVLHVARLVQIVTFPIGVFWMFSLLCASFLLISSFSKNVVFIF